MVLLYGIPGDGPFELVADALEEMNTPYVILNPRRYAEIDFILHVSNTGLEGEITVQDVSYNIHSFTGIYNRCMDFSTLPEAQQIVGTPAYALYAQQFDLLNQWIEQATCRVVNKGSAMSSNSSKPYQLSLITPFFDVPETLITNNPTSIETFQHQHNEIIYKSASSIRSIVKTVAENDNLPLQNIRFCPTLFQQKLNGDNYRVHIVDTQIFAIKATSQSVDYRYSSKDGNSTELVVVDLPADIADKCVALAQALQLPFAGIDLFKTNAGQWLCFEVNPSPGFSYFENQTGQPIAQAIATYLTGQ